MNSLDGAMKFIHFTARLFLPIVSTERVVTPQQLGFSPTDRSNVGDAPGLSGKTHTDYHDFIEENFHVRTDSNRVLQTVPGRES